MAGVPGKSGGARQGAGRKPKPKQPPTPLVAPGEQTAAGQPFDPRPTLEQIAMGLLEVPPQQFNALRALLPLVHFKKGEGGKKDADAEKAKKAGAGKFSPAAPPKLVAAGGKKV